MIILAIACMFCAILALLYRSKKSNTNVVPAQNYRDGAEDICNISACCDTTATAVAVPGETIQIQVQAVQTASSTLSDDDHDGPKLEVLGVETLEKVVPADEALSEFSSFTSIEGSHEEIAEEKAVVAEEAILECNSFTSIEGPHREFAETGTESADDESSSRLLPGPSILKSKSRPKLTKEERKRRPRISFAPGIEGGAFRVESECRAEYRMFRAKERKRAQEVQEKRVSSSLADLDFSEVKEKVLLAAGEWAAALHADEVTGTDALFVALATGMDLSDSPKRFTLPRFGHHLNMTKRDPIVQTFSEARRNLEAILEEALMSDAALGRGYDMRLDSRGRVYLCKFEVFPVGLDTSIFPNTYDMREPSAITWYLSELMEYFPLRIALVSRWPKCKMNHIDAFVSRVLEVRSDEASEALSQFRPYLKDPEEDLTLMELAIKIFEELFIQEAAEGKLAVQLRIRDKRLCWFKKDPHFRQSHVAVREDDPAYVPIRRPGEFLMRMSLMRQGLLNMINTENDLLVAPPSRGLDANEEDMNRFALHQCKSPYIEVNPHTQRDTSMWEGCAQSFAVPEMAFFGLPAPQQIHMAYGLWQVGRLHQLSERSLPWRRALVDAGKALILGQAAKQGLLDLTQGSGQVLNLSQNGAQPLSCVQDSVIIEQDDTSSFNLSQDATALMDLGQNGPSDSEALGVSQEADQEATSILDLTQSGLHHSSEPSQDDATIILDLTQSGLHHSLESVQDDAPFILELTQSGLHHSLESVQDDATIILDLTQSGLPHSSESVQEDATFVLDLTQSGSYPSLESAIHHSLESTQDDAPFILELNQSGLPHSSESVQDDAPFILELNQSGSHHSLESALQHSSEPAQEDATFVLDLAHSGSCHSLESVQDDAIFILDLNQSGSCHSSESTQEDAPFILELNQSGSYPSLESANHRSSEPSQDATQIMDLDQSGHQLLELAQDAATQPLDTDQSGYQLLDLAQDSTPFLDLHQSDHELLELVQDDILPAGGSENTQALNTEMKQTVMVQALNMEMKQTVIVVDKEGTEVVPEKIVPIDSATHKIYMSVPPKVPDPTVKPLINRSGVRMRKADSETLSQVSKGEVRALKTRMSISQNSTVTRNQLASENHRLRMERARRDKSVLKEKTGATPSSSLSTPRLNSRLR